MLRHGSSSNSSHCYLAPSTDEERVESSESDTEEDPRKRLSWSIDGALIGDNVAPFKSHIGKLVKAVVSPHYKDWHSWKKNSKAKKVHFYVGTHVRKDGITPTEETIRQIVVGRDGHGRVRGFGSILKTKIMASQPCMEELVEEGKESKKLRKALKKFLNQEGS